MKKETHWATIIGCDARTEPGYENRVGLWETVRYWKCTNGMRFKKEFPFHSVGDRSKFRLESSPALIFPRRKY